MSPNQILYPVFAMVALVFAVLARMRSKRFSAVRRGEIAVDFYKAFAPEAGAEPEPLRVIGRHFANLFEMPVLFYAVAILIYVTHQVTGWLVAGAWLYVALRYVHTAVHLGANDVRVRVAVYLASGLVLAALWLGLLVGLVRAG